MSYIPFTLPIDGLSFSSTSCSWLSHPHYCLRLLSATGMAVELSFSSIALACMGLLRQ